MSGPGARHHQRRQQVLYDPQLSYGTGLFPDGRTDGDHILITPEQISTLAGAPFQAMKANYLIGIFVCLLKLQYCTVQ